MAITLTKYVYENGAGDYPDIETAFNAMLASGVAATGDITAYTMLVDSGVYTGSLSGYIPYSGIFTIQGAACLFNLDKALSISGAYADPPVPNANLVLNDMSLTGSGITDPIIPIISGFGVKLQNVQLVNCAYIAHITDGYLITKSVQANGLGSQYFVNGTGIVDIVDTSISNFGTGIYINDITISNSNIFENDIGVLTPSGTIIDIVSSLIYNNTTEIQAGSGELVIQDSTISGEITISNTLLEIERSIIVGDITGTALSGSYIHDSRINESGYSDTTNITEHNNIYGDPLFNSSTYGDFRLQLKNTDGSPCIEHLDNPNIASGVTVTVDQAQLKIYDKKGATQLYDFLPYVYTQGATLVLSSYGKETKFSDTISKFKDLTYDLLATINFSEKNVQVKPSFDPDKNGIDRYPFDFDYKTIDSTQIESHNKYLIPRSIVNVDDILPKYLTSNLTSNVMYKNISTKNIVVYDQQNYRGVAYDSDLSTLDTSITWIIDGGNQSLIKSNSFTGEQINTYPLLSTLPTKTFIQPSGLIYVGVEGDYYKFRREDDPNIELLGENENGYFQWICTDMNTKYDIRGILSYKNNLFLTASDYKTQDVTDRSIVPSGEPLGKILWYTNNDLFYNYIKRPGDADGPKESVLSSGNFYPTDITAYEDGSLFIADYTYASGIFKYKLAYDYALVQSSYDNETKVLLREAYNNVDL